MASVVTSPEPELRTLTKEPSVDDGRGAGGGGTRERGGEGGGRRGPDPGSAIQRYKLGVWVGFGGIVMVFCGAYERDGCAQRAGRRLEGF